MIDRNHEKVVVISATCFADAKSAIELSAYLADSINANLGAYLFEDEAFYNSATFPFSRVISLGNRPRKVSPEAMLSAFERDAEAYKLAVEEIARKKSLNWTFEKRRGEFDLSASAANENVDLIVLGYQQLRKSNGEIIFLARMSDLEKPFLDLAASLAKSLHVPIHIALFPEKLGEPILLHDNSEQRLRQIAEKVSVIRGKKSLSEFVRSVQRTSPTAILAKLELVNEIGMQTLVDAGRCPMVLSTG